MRKAYEKNGGFTLIELSIVLVIIGLIVGGVLVGQELVAAATVRSQVSQISSYNTAANTFRTKYGYYPGDLIAPVATASGFAVGSGCSGTLLGQRNGDGILQGWISGNATILSQTLGETALFWEDLSDAKFIEGKYPNGPTTETNANGPIFNCAGGITLLPTQLPLYFPVAKLGLGNYVYVYTDGNYNWFGIGQITATYFYGGTPVITPNIPVNYVYNIDKKIDDGSPVGGKVMARYITLSTPPTTVLLNAPNVPTAGGDSTSCYDTTTNTYSTSQNGGKNMTCALSIQLQ